MGHIHYINRDFLTLHTIGDILGQKKTLQLSAESSQQIEQCRRYLEDKLANSKQAFYGINTGFGSLYKIKISDEQSTTLQSNLVMSHACGMGDLVPEEVIRLMLLLKIQSLSYGHSGIRKILVERLMQLYNENVLPVIYQLGSLGASGDLSPLAHLSLPLIGMGEVWYKGERRTTASVYKELDWQPLELQSKEGLALLNGTQFSTAYGVWILLKSKRLASLANRCAAISIDAFNGNLSPFDDRLHQIRPHKGQIAVAKSIRDSLQNSAISESKDKSVQDPYAFRCVPQVHGASLDAIAHIEQVFSTEVNSVTDNPNIFPATDGILSGGNFHAQPLALPLDYLAIALAELGNISERRTYQLVAKKNGLPEFLIQNAGLNSGLMIPQYTAASIVSQNKQLCTPASVDSIVSSNGQEDHVSMAANAATKAYRVVENLERILAIEFMTAAQALEFRRPLQSSPIIEKMIADYRLIIPPLSNDRILSKDMHETVEFLRKFVGY